MFMLPKAFSTALALVCLTTLPSLTFAQECGAASAAAPQATATGGNSTLQSGPFSVLRFMQNRAAAQNQFRQIQFQRQMLFIQQQRLQHSRLQQQEKEEAREDEPQLIVKDIEPRKKTQKEIDEPSADERLQAAMLKLERRSRR